jgi:hypothetical protein
MRFRSSAAAKLVTSIAQARGFAGALAVAVTMLCAQSGSPLQAQDQSPEEKLEERLKMLTDPEGVKKKLEKEKSRPPLELFRTQVAPFDILPYVKANHWSTISLELRANYDDYTGSLQTAPVPLLGLPLEIIYRRDARLVKAQQSRIGMQVLLPRVPRELNLELIRPDAIRADEGTPGSLRTLERHQMLMLFLTKDANAGYASWNRFQAFYPTSVDRSDIPAVERTRYYRMVLPLDEGKPALSSHPLTWSTISHIVWDGFAPDTLNPSQQQAMLDWLHWGGQLTLVGGPGAGFSLLKDSFLAPYLPADAEGENALLSRDDLKPLSASYPPPFHVAPLEGQEGGEFELSEPELRLPGQYRTQVAIKPAPDRPVFLAGLVPKPGAVGIPLGASSGRLVAVEQRVGRGRILMLALSPLDPAVAAWPGLDTFVRRVVMRRPEEERLGLTVWNGRQHEAPAVNLLPAGALSWVRYLSRDIGAVLARGPQRPPPVPPVPPIPPGGAAIPKVAIAGSSTALPDELDIAEEYTSWNADTPVAEWIDSSLLPRMCRDALEKASGIKIPNAGFVLKVLLAYIIVLVPLNWLAFRYIIRRRELAWVTVPLLAFGFAVGVERAAAYDMGYNSACDEIDILETFGAYPRAHVSRFASLYSNGRTRYTISYPNNPTAVALPLDNGRSLRGEDISSAVWQSYPIPALEGYLIQPRSLAMFRAEEMTTLDGSITLEGDGDQRQILNGTSMELRDAVLVGVGKSEEKVETYLGTIAPRATVEVRAVEGAESEARDGDFSRDRFLEAFRDYYEDRPENHRELRLVAWTPQLVGGQNIEPQVDRHRGYTAVVAHLRFGPPPKSDDRVYFALAKGADARLEFRAPETRGGPPTLPGAMPGGGLPARKARPRPPAPPQPAGPAPKRQP